MRSVRWVADVTEVVEEHQHQRALKTLSSMTVRVAKTLECLGFLYASSKSMDPLERSSIFVTFDHASEEDIGDCVLATKCLLAQGYLWRVSDYSET